MPGSIDLSSLAVMTSVGLKGTLSEGLVTLESWSLPPLKMVPVDHRMISRIPAMAARIAKTMQHVTHALFFFSFFSLTVATYAPEM